MIEFQYWFCNSELVNSLELTTVGQKLDNFDLLWKYVRSKLFCFQKSTAKRLTVVAKKNKTRADYTKPNVEIFFDYNGNKSCKEGHKQNFGKSWNYWVNSVALSKEKQKWCFYTEISSHLILFGHHCMTFHKFMLVMNFVQIWQFFYFFCPNSQFRIWKWIPVLIPIL